MRKKARKTKLEDLDRYIAQCKYCDKEVSSQQSFVSLVKTLNPISYNYNVHSYVILVLVF